MAAPQGEPLGNVGPPVGAILDAGDPINRGLIGYFLLNEGAGSLARNLASRLGGAYTAPTKWGPAGGGKQFGQSPALSAISGEYVNLGPYYDFSASLEFSLSFWAYLPAANQTDGAGLICCGNGGVGEQYCVDVRSAASGGAIRFFTRNAGTLVNGNIASANNVALSNTKWRHVVATFSGGNTSQRLYIDGLLAASVGVTQSLNPVLGHITSVGARQSAVGAYDQPIAGKVANVRIYSRAILPTEVLRLFNEPFPGLADFDRKTRSTSGGSPTVNYTLTCAAGAYAYVGQAATLSLARKLPLAVGAYTYAGNAATLTYVPRSGAVAYTLTCAAGTYAYVGNAATLKLARKLVLAAGAYSYVGNAATLTYVSNVKVNYALACNAGAYSYVGGAATLTYRSGASQDGGGGTYLYPNWQPYWIDKREWEEKVPAQVAKVIERIARQDKSAEIADLELQLEVAEYEARYSRMLAALQQSQFESLSALRKQQLKLIAEIEDEDDLLFLMG